jgi:hypothetical protein
VLAAGQRSGDNARIEPGMKAMLSIGLYLCLVFVIGYVMAMTAPRETCEQENLDDDR